MNLRQMVNSRRGQVKRCAYSCAVWEFSDAAETLAARPWPPFDCSALDAIMLQDDEEEAGRILDGGIKADGCWFVRTSPDSRLKWVALSTY
jgi:hypothetical protein